ncbi:unnamed protein product [Trichobilharzia szidati]|nr:unnamed protein product [Trichobilharzia szidati]
MKPDSKHRALGNRLRKFGFSLSQSKVNCSASSKKHLSQVNRYKGIKPRISIPLKPTGYKSSRLVHRKDVQPSTSRSEEGRHIENPKSQSNQNPQTGTALLKDSVDANESSIDLSNVPNWLRETIHPIKNYFREDLSKLENMTKNRKHQMESNLSSSQLNYASVHKTLKAAKDNLPCDIDEIFSNLGLGTWINEYRSGFRDCKEEKLSVGKDTGGSRGVLGCQTSSSSLPSLNPVDLDREENLMKEGVRRTHPEHGQLQLINTKTSDKRPTDEEKLKPSTSNSHNAGCGSELKKASQLLTGKASCQLTNSTTHHQTSRNPYTLMQKDALDREFFAKLIEAKCNEYETSRQMKKHREYKGGEIKSRGKHRSFEDYACRPSTSLHYQPIPSTSFDKENKEIRGSISDECFHKLHSNQRGDKSTETPTIRQISPPQHPIWDTPADLRTSSNYFFRP